MLTYKFYITKHQNNVLSSRLCDLLTHQAAIEKTCSSS